jgi:hypothetical protein
MAIPSIIAAIVRIVVVIFFIAISLYFLPTPSRR